MNRLTASGAAAWHPVASSSDLVPRHVFQGQLHGRELALWRADDGYVNVWENRCLHRGVRLSIGVSDGRELKCQYHGWRYATRTYIPAHPADAPARTICNRTFPAVERYGLVWTTLDETAPQDVPELSITDRLLVLRPVVVMAPVAAVLAALRADAAAGGMRVDYEADVRLDVSGDQASGALTFFVQPLDETRCVVRGLLHAIPAGAPPLELLRARHRALSRLRDRLEAQSAAQPRQQQRESAFDRLPEELSQLPPGAAAGRSPSLRVTVERKWTTGTDVAALSLAPLTGALPTAQPGAHIDVHLPTGDIRQYSIVNAPGEADRYVIGVKREPQSSGGSICLHDSIREGDLLAVSEPRNNFPLRRDAKLTHLIAGGIGITPLLAMAQALSHQGLPFRLHCFAQSERHLAFPERLSGLGDSVRRYCGLDPRHTRDQLTQILSDDPSGRQVYVCGPGPMIEAARDLAADAGWPVEQVHFEYFKNTNAIDKQSSFELALARSVLTVQVAPGQTILETIRAAGVQMPSSCEQGACGTCIATVIEGEPVHQDVYLNAAEKASGQMIMTCVSRCASPRLVLDL
jgi:ferredoxin-NADP reductase/nitrite reductase/ring-hydroxylating ferredoxin subunit